MNWKVLGAGFLVVAPLVVVLASGFGRDPKALPNVMEGREAPSFSLTDLDGQPVRLAELRGKPVVLNFWASWCTPCAYEHPELLAAAQRWAPQGVAFYGVVYGDTEEAARGFLKRRGSAYPNLLDLDQRVAIDYGVAGVPETYVIDRQGRIARKFVGPVSAKALSDVLGSL
ncbi:TlpA family protein disulfide reductase [Myxococcota bacterium]|nr:TlpA family protein disulfide reductase [Myxococcota bacterium]